jgi:hypothetical protein
LSGIATISDDFSSVCTSALSVWSSCVSDTTVTVSVTAPTSIVTVTRAIWPIVTGTSLRRLSRNPCSETLTS